MEQNEILEETRRTNELLRGQLLWTRVAAALLAVLLTAVVVCLGNTMNSMGRISAALEGVDLAAVAEQIAAAIQPASRVGAGTNNNTSCPEGRAAGARAN